MYFVKLTGGLLMGRVFATTETYGRRNTLEQKNLRRIFCVALFMAIISVVLLCITGKSGTDTAYRRIYGAGVIYAVVSAAFSFFSFQLLQRKGKRSGLWLFEMAYAIINISFLTCFSYWFWNDTGSLTVYCLVVILNSCTMIYHKEEYALCVGIECLVPVLLRLKGVLLPQYFIVILAVHILGAAIAFECYRSYKLAEKYRRKYMEEIRAAEFDSLTKVNNRRGMMHRVGSIWPVLKGANCPVAVLIIDVDHFKKYNDRFGHPCGDVCLQRVAENVCETIKGESAFVSRIGGEEFLVFAYGLEAEKVYSLAEKIRGNIEGMGIPHAKEARYRNVTVSIGAVSDYCTAEISFGGLYRRADRELYTAKNSGRNQVSFQNGGVSTQKRYKAGI